MKAIVIEEDKFEEAFQQTRDKLELKKLRDLPADPEAAERVRQMHRKFNYEVVRLKKRLEEE